MKSFPFAAALLLSCMVFTPATIAQRPKIQKDVRAWLVTDDGRVPVEETSVRYLTRNVDYSCVRKPLFEVAGDLAELVPVTVNRQALKQVGVTLNMQVSIPKSKRLIDVLAHLNRQFDFGIITNAKTIEITTIEDCDRRELTHQYDVTELVAYEGKPVSQKWSDTKSLQRLIYTAIAPDTWPVGNAQFPVKAEKERVLISISQDSWAHLEIKALLDTLVRVAEGKRIAFELKSRLTKSKLGNELKSWPVKTKNTDESEVSKVIYDVTGHFADVDAAGPFIVERLSKISPYSQGYWGYATFAIGEKSVLILWGSKQIHDAMKRLKFPAGKE